MDLMFELMENYESVEDFLREITLSSNIDIERNNKVTLMTIHASKGMEFDYVFLVRANQGTFPSQHSLTMPSVLEEERRLFYVAITRAKRYLHVSFVKKDNGFGGPYNWVKPSQFLKEAKLI